MEDAEKMRVTLIEIRGLTEAALVPVGEEDVTPLVACRRIANLCNDALSMEPLSPRPFAAEGQADVR